MPFLKRLGFYLFGLSIGLIFLAFFWKKKSDETGVEFCYLPNCRVLKDIRSKPITYSDIALEFLNNKALDSIELGAFLKNGEVDFGRSNTKAEPCRIYFIEGMFRQEQVTMVVENCSEKATITQLEK